MIHKITINSTKHNRLYTVVGMFKGLSYECSSVLFSEDYFYFSIDEHLITITSININIDITTGRLGASSLTYLNKSELYNIITCFLEGSTTSTTRCDKLSDMVMAVDWSGSNPSTDYWKVLHNKVQDNE